MPAYEIVWWGERNGGRRTSPVTGRSAATESTIVAASASASRSGGSNRGAVLASRVLPAPGGPIISNPCPPARAISNARRASTWPRTSPRSGTSGSGAIGDAGSPRPAGRSGAASTRAATVGNRRRDDDERRIRIASPREPAPIDSIPSTSRASARASAGTMTRRTPRRARAATIGSRPGTGRTSPPSDSSPTSAQRPAARTCSEPSRIAAAIPRSSEAPRLGRSAGARLTVIRRGGYVKPLLRIAPRTRSRASWSAVSARPTIEKPGRPGATSTSTRTTLPARPWTVADRTVASTIRRLDGCAHPRLIGPSPAGGLEPRNLSPGWSTPRACRRRPGRACPRPGRTRGASDRAANRRA